jgi:hypothetical protein
MGRFCMHQMKKGREQSEKMTFLSVNIPARQRRSGEEGRGGP